MSAESRERFRATVCAPTVDLAEACLLLAADFDEGLDEPGAVERWTARIDGLGKRVPARGADADRLRSVLGPFHGTAADYADLRSSLLHEVVRRHRGLPILLSVLWLEVAARAGIAAYGVGMPGHFVVGLGDRPTADGAPVPPAAQLVDPFSGGVAVTGRAGRQQAWVWEPVETIERVLANIRHWADRPERIPVRLQAVELTLLLPRHSLALRREHGQLMVRCGDFLGGAAELDAYAAAVEPVDEVSAETARREARGARARLN